MKTFTERYNTYLYKLKKQVIKSIKKDVVSIIKAYKKFEVYKGAKICDHTEYGLGLDCRKGFQDYLRIDDLKSITNIIVGVHYIYQEGVFDDDMERQVFVKWPEIEIESLVKLADFLKHFRKNI